MEKKHIHHNLEEINIRIDKIHAYIDVIEDNQIVLGKETISEMHRAVYNLGVEVKVIVDDFHVEFTNGQEETDLEG